jgi:hypothetical protein
MLRHYLYKHKIHALLVRRLAHWQRRVFPSNVLRHPLQLKGMLMRLFEHRLVSMSIVLRHFSHFHSFMFTGFSSIPCNTRYC